MNVRKRKKSINGPRDLIVRAMRELDSDGALSRRRNRLRRKNYRSLGPNHIWYADGYNKLITFRFRIHSCIDGYSRKILWLSVLKSNNNPVTIALFYLDNIRLFSILYTNRLRVV